LNKFVFSLQSVLNLKEKLESQEKVLFQAAMEELRKEEAELALLEQRKRGYEERLREAVCSRLDLLSVKTNKEAIEVIKEMIRQQTGKVRRAERHAEIARNRLEEAMKERKTLEKLKEDAFSEYKKEYEKEEQKEIDELVSFRHKTESVGEVTG